MTNFSPSSSHSNLNTLLKGRSKLLQPHEERELTRKYVMYKDPYARERLVMSNLGLVAKAALTYSTSGVPIEDLFQEGTIGLMRAIEKFNPSLGFRLGTYASFWIQASIQAFVINNWNIVKVGTTSLERQAFFGLGDINKATTYEDRVTKINEFVRKKKEESDRKIRLTSEDVEIALNRIQFRDLSLDQNLRNGESSETWADCVLDPGPVCEEIYQHEDTEYRVKIYIKESLSCLDTRERYIIKKRHLSEERTTLQHIAEEFGVTRERIRQLEKRALKKMEYHLKMKEQCIKELLVA
jgi:RNA polymerase sigma-32 factor